MAFFSTQKVHKIKRSHSTERIKPSPTGSTTSIPSSVTSLPPTHIWPSSRPVTSYVTYPTDGHVRGRDPQPPATKSNATTPGSRHSLRRIPVPSLSFRDLDRIPCERPRTSPTMPSSRSTSVSRKSSIADIGGAANATVSKTIPDHFKLSTNIRIPTSPYSNHWESASGLTRSPGGAYDLRKSSSPILDLSNRIPSPQQVAIPMPSPKPTPPKPQRAVLRRKSNAKQPLKSQPSLPSLGRRKSKPDLGISSATVIPQRTISAQQPIHVVSTQKSLDTAHSVRRSTSGERKLRDPGNMSPPVSPLMLTPAGAVAAAYKEQEKRKRATKRFVGTNTDWSRGDFCDDGGAYYTVFGSSGKVVAVGAPESESWLHSDLSSYAPNKPKSVSRKPSLGALGTRLSRKSSTKTKKIGIGNVCGTTSESECGHEKTTRGDEVGRLSLQGRRSMSTPGRQRNRRPPGISTDNSNVGMISDSPLSASTLSKPAGWSTDDPSPSTGGKIWKLMKRISTGGLKDKYNSQEVAPPVPALPKGLTSTPPTKPKTKTHPIPHPPDDPRPSISRYIRGRSSFGDAPFSNRQRNTQGVPGSATPHRPPTLNGGKNPSHRRRSTNTRSSSPVSSDMASSKYWQKSRSSSVSTFEEMPPLPGRVIKAGAILTPVELDKLEKEQAMAELSTPPSTVDSHSPTPSPSNPHRNTLIAIRKSSLRGTQLRANGDDSETDGMNAEDFVALPSPPRHRYRSNPPVFYQQSNDSGPAVGSGSTSPTIPMFSTIDAVNHFHSSKGDSMGMSRSLNSSLASHSTGISSNEFGAMNSSQPPPRPQRSEKRRPPVVNQHVAVRASQDRERSSHDRHRGRPSTSVPRPKEKALGGSLKPGDDDGDGRSYGTFGSYQSKGIVELVKTSQDSGTRENLGPRSRSLLRFREMESGEGGGDKKALTEKEKADKWDDLLEKSDRAGGTIHIGNAKLLSDSLRFSDYSTLTLSAL